MDPFLVAILIDSVVRSLLFVTNVVVGSNILVSGNILITKLKGEKTHCQNKIISDTSFVDLKTTEERKSELIKKDPPINFKKNWSPHGILSFK